MAPHEDIIARDDTHDDTLPHLQNWYTDQCNDDWEHRYGVSIETLDNPGWRVVVELTGTVYAEMEMDTIEIKRSTHDWVHAWIDCRTFHGDGGPGILNEIIAIFRDVINRSGISISPQEREAKRLKWEDNTWG